jgi:hypothetical protein
MNNQEGQWAWDVTEVTLRKTPAYGLPYTAICTVKIVDKEVHVVGLLSKEGLTRVDLISINKIVKSLGYDTYSYKRGRNL